MTARSWFFQANSSIYRILDVLAELRTLHWPVKQYADEIHIGDMAHIWESGPAGGLLARTRITSEPSPDPSHKRCVLLLSSMATSTSPGGPFLNPFTPRNAQELREGHTQVNLRDQA